MRVSQTQGPIGFLVDRMIRRSVGRGFHGVWWSPPESTCPRTIFVANHHGWYDGYLMYHAVTRLGCPAVDWIAEFDSFPLFRYVGGMPFSPRRPMERAATVKKTIRRMNDEGISLVLFGEGILHRPPELLEFGRSLKTVADHVTEAVIMPVAIRYELSLHERPEAFLCFGEKMPRTTKPEEVREEVQRLLVHTRDSEKFQPLAAGTKDVNERWDMRNAPWKRSQ